MYDIDPIQEIDEPSAIHGKFTDETKTTEHNGNDELTKDLKDFFHVYRLRHDVNEDSKYNDHNDDDDDDDYKDEDYQGYTQHQQMRCTLVAQPNFSLQ